MLKSGPESCGKAPEIKATKVAGKSAGPTPQRRVNASKVAGKSAWVNPSEAESRRQKSLKDQPGHAWAKPQAGESASGFFRAQFGSFWIDGDARILFGME
jgi:hypothetical protein